MRWVGHVACMGEERGVYRVLVRKLEGKRPLGRRRRWWVDNIRMDLQEVGCGYMDWIGMAQDRDRWLTLVSAVMNLRVPWNAGNFLTSCKPVSCSRRTLHHGVSKHIHQVSVCPHVTTSKIMHGFPLTLLSASFIKNGHIFIHLRLKSGLNDWQEHLTKYLQKRRLWRTAGNTLRFYVIRLLGTVQHKRECAHQLRKFMLWPRHGWELRSTGLIRGGLW